MKAFVVGINDYPNVPLKAPIDDALNIKKLLEKNEDGSPNFEVRLGIDIKTKSELKKEIVKLFSGKTDIALFYFSGHGFLNEIGGYLVTPDFKSYDEGISMDEILHLANESESTNKIIILDCCYSGRFGSPSVLGKNSFLKTGVTILSSSKDSEESEEIDGKSIFTNLLIEALRGGASDICGNITPGGVYSYVDKSLGRWDQRPVFKTNVSEFISLRKVNPPIPIETLRELINYFPDPDYYFSLDPSFEFTNSPTVKHEVKQPYADPTNISIFNDLQKFEGVGIVIPNNEEHMYFAAMNSQSCRLTPIGKHFWRLIKKNRI